jgi:hypothetical protein
MMSSELESEILRLRAQVIYRLALRMGYSVELESLNAQVASRTDQQIFEAVELQNGSAIAKFFHRFGIRRWYARSSIVQIRGEHS